MRAALKILISFGNLAQGSSPPSLPENLHSGRKSKSCLLYGLGVLNLLEYFNQNASSLGNITKKKHYLLMDELRPNIYF
jgi:hypothetical protein